MWIWIIIAVIILAALYFWGNAISKKESQDAPKRLAEAQLAFDQGDMNLCLSHLYHAFFVPFEEEYEKEQAEVALKVIDLMEKVRIKTDGDYQKMIDKIRPYLEHASKDGGNVSEKLTSQIKDFLSEQNDLDEEGEDDYPKVKIILENTEALNGGSLKGIVKITGGEELHHLEEVNFSANKEVNGSEQLDGLGYLSQHYFWERIEPKQVKEIPFEFFLQQDDLELYKDATYELNVSLEGTDEDLYIQDDVAFTVSEELAPNYRTERNGIYFCEEDVEELFVGVHNSRYVSMHNIKGGVLTNWGSLFTARNKKGELLWKRNGFEEKVAISPEGDKILKSSTKTKDALHILSAETGEILVSTDIDWEFYYMIWVKDYIVLSHEKTVYILDEELNLIEKIEKLSKKEDDSIYSMSPSIDGNNILFCINGSQVIIEFNPKTKEKNILSNEAPVVESIKYSADKKRAISRDWEDLTTYSVDDFNVSKTTKLPGLRNICNFDRDKDSTSTWIIDEFIDFHPNGEKVVTNNGSGELLILDLVSKTSEHITRDIANLVESVLWLDEDTIALIDSKGKYKLLSYTKKEIIFEEQEFYADSILEIGMNKIPMEDWLTKFTEMVGILEKNPGIKITNLNVNSPVKSEEIEQIELKLGFELPQDIKNFYKQCNGLQFRWVSSKDEYVNEEEFERSMVTTALPNEEMYEQGNASGIINILTLQDMLFDEVEEGEDEGNTQQFGLRKYNEVEFYKKLKTFDKYTEYYSMNILFIDSDTANFVTFGDSFSNYVFNFDDYLSFLILSYGLIKEKNNLRYKEESIGTLIEKYSDLNKIDLSNYDFTFFGFVFIL